MLVGNYGSVKSSTFSRQFVAKQKAALLHMRSILILESKGRGESMSFSCRSGRFGRERQGYCSKPPKPDLQGEI